MPTPQSSSRSLLSPTPCAFQHPQVTEMISAKQLAANLAKEWSPNTQRRRIDGIWLSSTTIMTMPLIACLRAVSLLRSRKRTPPTTATTQSRPFLLDYTRCCQLRNAMASPTLSRGNRTAAASSYTNRRSSKRYCRDSSSSPKSLPFNVS